MLDFNCIKGHDQLKKHLQGAIAKDKVHHAYILQGEKGMGKKTIAGAFSKALLCENRIEIEGMAHSCNKCKSCMQIQTKNHPDLIYVTHEKASIGVDDIRAQVNNHIGIKPYSSKYKIYVIDDAQLMTEAAQNALLKTIEEPPEYGVILLLANNVNSILSTILSRCIILNLKPVEKHIIKDYLMDHCAVPDYMAGLSADFSGGNLGLAIEYATSEEFMDMKDQVVQLLNNIDRYEVFELIEHMKKISEDKKKVDNFLDLMILWFRDVLMCKVTKDPNVVLFQGEYRNIIRQAEIRSYNQLETIINGIEKAKMRIRANVNLDIAIEMMLLTIKENENG